MSEHGTCLSAFLVSKLQQLIGIIIFYPKKKEKNVILTLLHFHWVSCPCIIWFFEMEGMVARNNFAKAFVTPLSCALCWPAFCCLIYISPTPLCSCVQVHCTRGRELGSAAQQGLAAKRPQDGSSGRKVSPVFYELPNTALFKTL